MAKVTSIHALKPHEWVSLASGLLVAGAIYVLLIHPSLESLSSLPRMRIAKQAAQEELERTQDKLHRIERQIGEQTDLLDKIGGAPPPAGQKDLQIARITALADRCNVKITQYLPIDAVDYPDHRAYMVEFVAHASFLDIQRLFTSIESTIDFVDVTNFSINTVQPQENSLCLVTWSCRINGVREEMPTPLLAANTPPRTHDGGRTP